MFRFSAASKYHGADFRASFSTFVNTAIFSGSAAALSFFHAADMFKGLIARISILLSIIMKDALLDPNTRPKTEMCAA